MDYAEATWKARYLRREDSFGSGLADQTLDGDAVSGTSTRFSRIRQRDPRTGTCDIVEGMNSEWIASADEQRGAAILGEKTCLRADHSELAQFSQRLGPGHHDIGVKTGLAAYVEHQVA